MHTDTPSAGDYAHAAARQAQQDASAALAKEQENAQTLDYIRLRQTILEEQLELTDIISEEIQRRRRIEIPPQMVGDTVIPEGYQGHVENGQIVFRPVD